MHEHLNIGKVWYPILHFCAKSMSLPYPWNVPTISMQYLCMIAFSALGFTCKPKSTSTWYPDSMASNHMTFYSENHAMVQKYNGLLQSMLQMEYVLHCSLWWYPSFIIYASCVFISSFVHWSFIRWSTSGKQMQCLTFSFCICCVGLAVREGDWDRT